MRKEIMGTSREQESFVNVPKSSRVFISYSHDSLKHKERVLQLSNRLCSEGIDCNIDRYETSPQEGWFRWMVNQIEEADFVLIVCTENYEKRFKGKDETGKGLGANWEGAIITQELYYSEANNKCIPIVFSPESSKYIPSILKSVTYYVLNNDEIYDDAYDELYGRLTNQKIVIKPNVGKLRHLKSRNFPPSISMQNREVGSSENRQKPGVGELRKITLEEGNEANPGKSLETLKHSIISNTFVSPSIVIDFVLIPAGKFMMGLKTKNSGFRLIKDAFVLDEFPLHEVTINYSYYLGKFPVTQKQWKDVMGKTPCTFKGDDYPVETVSWEDAQIFIKKLNEKEGTDKYRLPSEAEWEYACRAGTETLYYFGDDKSQLKEYSCNGFLNFTIKPVGQKKPNSWGLYDMHGNVWEWVQDNWHGNYNNAPSDGRAWEDETDSKRVRRGGCWSDSDWYCRSAIRLGNDPKWKHVGNGFRVCKEL